MPSYSRTVQIPGKSAQELYDKVSGDIDRFMGKAAIGKIDIQRDEAGKAVTVNTSVGVTATLQCKEGQIQVEGKLSLFATPFKSKIDDGINRWLEKTFNVQQG